MFGCAPVAVRRPYGPVWLSGLAPTRLLRATLNLFGCLFRPPSLAQGGYRPPLSQARRKRKGWSFPTRQAWPRCRFTSPHPPSVHPRQKDRGARRGAEVRGATDTGERGGEARRRQPPAATEARRAATASEEDDPVADGDVGRQHGRCADVREQRRPDGLDVVALVHRHILRRRGLAEHRDRAGRRREVLQVDAQPIVLLAFQEQPDAGHWAVADAGHRAVLLQPRPWLVTSSALGLGL